MSQPSYIEGEQNQLPSDKLSDFVVFKDVNRGAERLKRKRRSKHTRSRGDVHGEVINALTMVS